MAIPRRLFVVTRERDVPCLPPGSCTASCPSSEEWAPPKAPRPASRIPETRTRDSPERREASSLAISYRCLNVALAPSCDATGAFRTERAASVDIPFFSTPGNFPFLSGLACEEWGPSAGLPDDWDPMKTSIGYAQGRCHSVAIHRGDSGGFRGILA